ncbi:PcfJ domain-containing protein [Sulfurimonas sp.]|uniref:PcfJ domain-containing protein n=1 Tax=Sulfurimonas sp. TaxID=2022749 RepID=UPI0019E17F64|nr:PcfJ domain-containing protein [Sulfurimonas sp.]MBE0515695.1 PcfJ domain-containing protein [Sulfurimonas sp.]
MREDITPSWLLNTKQNDHMSLFVDDEIASANFTRVYSCKCGFNEIIAGNVIREEYSCPRCHNSLFFDVEDIKKDFDSFILDQYYNKRIKLNFKLHTKVALHNNKVEALAIIKIPSNVNFLEKKVIKQDLVILTAPYTSKPIELEPSPLRKIKRELQKLSVQKRLFESYIDMKLSSLPSRREKQFEFTLSHYNLKNFEFMKWTHTHHLTKSKYTIETALIELLNDKQFKSVKIALFENYAYQLKNNKTFNPNFVHMATSKFSNINHIVSLLALKLNFEVFDDEQLLFKFIDFMLSRYTERQVTHYFMKLESSNHQYILRDTLLTFKRIRELLSHDTSKVKCSPNAIHRQFVQLSLTIKYKNKPINHFEYSTLQLSHQVKMGAYNVNLPKNNFELFEWANELQNCLAGYEDKIASHETTIYGFFMQSNLIFAVEIQMGAIIQAHRKYNLPIKPEQRKTLNLWLKESKERVAMAKQVQEHFSN